MDLFAFAAHAERIAMARPTTEPSDAYVRIPRDDRTCVCGALLDCSIEEHDVAHATFAASILREIAPGAACR